MESNIRENINKYIFIIVYACMLIKSYIFYSLMNIDINFYILAAVSGLILILMFSGFKRLWIAFILSLLLSMLMFGDVVFNAYFNGYLSVSMLGSARYVGDVWDVIREILRPEFFLLFFDIPVLAIILYFYKNNYSKEAKRWPVLIIATFLILTIILGSLTENKLFKSLGNLEFFSYHIKDVVIYVAGWDESPIKGEKDNSKYQSDEEDKLFGIAEGRNLIVVQMEAMQNFVINRDYMGQEITPVLNDLIRQAGTLYFDNYYMQIAAGNTSDAEFATNNSLYGTVNSYTYEIYKDNTFRGLPILLKERGYKTVAMHGYEGSFWSRDSMYPAQGFDIFIDDEGYEPSTVHGWGILDEEFYTQSVEYLADLDQPFYSFMVSLSNHTPFKMEEQYESIELTDKHKGTRFGNYLNSVSYSDKALKNLFDGLKEAGLYDNSVIAIYGDHFGLAQQDEDNEVLMSEFLGRPYRFDEMARIPLIIHIPGTDIKKTISIAGGQLDFMPTIAYLLGFETLDTLCLGQNLLTADEGFVIQSRYAPKGSFIIDDVIYFMSLDQVFENGKAWSINTGEELSLDGLKPLSEKAAGLVELSEQYLKDDVFTDGSWRNKN